MADGPIPIPMLSRLYRLKSGMPGLPGQNGLEPNQIVGWVSDLNRFQIVHMYTRLENRKKAIAYSFSSVAKLIFLAAWIIWRS